MLPAMRLQFFLLRELTQLRTSTAASASSTETSVSPHASNQQQATELVAAQKACNMAEAKANSLRDSIQQLTSRYMLMPQPCVSVYAVMRLAWGL